MKAKYRRKVAKDRSGKKSVKNVIAVKRQCAKCGIHSEVTYTTGDGMWYCQKCISVAP